MLKDQNSGIRGAQKSQLRYIFIFFVLVLLPGLLGIVFAVVSFPAVQSLSWLPFNFQVASLTFSCQKDEEEPGKQQLPRESRGGSDRRVFIASFSLQFFHNFMVPGREAGEAEAHLLVTASAEGQSGPTDKVKKDKAAQSAGLQGNF